MNYIKILADDFAVFMIRNGGFSDTTKVSLPFTLLPHPYR